MSKLKKEYIKKKKNYLPTLVIAGFLWLVAFLIFFFVDPKIAGIVPLFVITLFFALLFSLSLLFANTRRGIEASVAIISYLILSILGLGNLLNLLLIVGAALAFEIYFLKRA